MRQKFQQRKSAVDSNNPEPNSASNVVDSKPKSSIGSMQKHQSAAAGGSKNLNTSFSAMNTSLQQKWSALKNTKTASARGDNMSSTMIGGGQPGR